MSETKITLRKLRKTDIAAAAKIVEQNYSKHYAKLATLEMEAMFGSDTVSPTYVAAVADGQLVGFAGYMVSWMDYHIANIFWVNVDPLHQRAGIGKMLVGEIVRRAQKNKRMHLLLLSTSSPAYYRRHFKFKTIARFGPKAHHLMSLSVQSPGIRKQS